MHRRPILVTIVALAVSLFLGGTVFRDEVASARALAQSVIVTNSPDQAIPVSVTNTPAIRPAIPEHAFSEFGHEPDHLRVLSGPDPPGTSYAITSVTGWTTVGGDGGWVHVYGRYLDITCGEPEPASSQSPGPTFFVPAGGSTIHLAYPQPFIIDALQNNQPSCLVMQSQTHGLQPYVEVVGYRF